MRKLTSSTAGPRRSVFHAQAGYGKTFERVFRGLIGGLEVSGALSVGSDFCRLAGKNELTDKV